MKVKTTLENHSNMMQFSFSENDHYPSVDSIHAEKEIHIKINHLHDEFREPFQLFLNGFKYKEISEKLGLPLGTVKSRIFFTRKKLSVSLSEYVN
jgi:RNA polymerase sigma-70 factor (ECF subfamily)